MRSGGRRAHPTRDSRRGPAPTGRSRPGGSPLGYDHTVLDTRKRTATALARRTLLPSIVMFIREMLLRERNEVTDECVRGSPPSRGHGTFRLVASQRYGAIPDRSSYRENGCTAWTPAPDQVGSLGDRGSGGGRAWSASDVGRNDRAGIESPHTPRLDSLPTALDCSGLRERTRSPHPRAGLRVDRHRECA
jgi:hypothetical protein